MNEYETGQRRSPEETDRPVAGTSRPDTDPPNLGADTPARGVEDANVDVPGRDVESPGAGVPGRGVDAGRSTTEFARIPGGPPTGPGPAGGRVPDTGVPAPTPVPADGSYPALPGTSGGPVPGPVPGPGAEQPGWSAANPQGGPRYQPGWAGVSGGHSGHPGAGLAAGTAPPPPYPGGTGPVPGYPAGGGPLLPGWGGPHPAPPAGPAKVGRYVAAGFAALALMLGSGVAGGALALAVSAGSSGGRTYQAAPVINSADLPGIAARVENSVVSISTGDGEGSGVVLSADGYVLTNNHVVASASGRSVKVIFVDGKSATAKIVGTDPRTDLAVVRAEGVSDLTPATFGDSDAMQVGDTVLALGSPLGLQGSVTAGIVSARDRTIQAGGGGEPDSPFQRQQGGSSISGLLQTDAPINPGNSGGALVNTNAEVIGINTAIATAGQGNGNIGVGFAIPSNKAKQVAEVLRRGDKVSHPSLGVSVTPAENGGALVGAVKEGGPAARAGIQQGDVITRFGGKAINNANDLVAVVQAGRVGDQVPVTYTRNGSEQSATVTLAEAS